MTISGVLAPSPPTYRRALRPAGLRRNGVNCAGQVDWLFGIEEEKKRCVSSWDRQPGLISRAIADGPCPRHARGHRGYDLETCIYTNDIDS